MTAGLTEDQREALFRIKQNRRTALPAEYRVLNIDANQAGILRSQLAAERIASERGETARAELGITVGEQERADQAAADFAMNLGAIEAVWAATVGGCGSMGLRSGSSARGGAGAGSGVNGYPDLRCAEPSLRSGVGAAAECARLEDLAVLGQANAEQVGALGAAQREREASRRSD